ncbi:MAG TPA: DUF2723 domain-containing protein, partial [Gemmatimonadaceae bacterium]|nr:DUF2723 domain-containing protein [Gemmatimonadaceae bacterium]
MPHPPGTPLFVTAARAWTVTLGTAFTPAFATNLLSAACTAAACGLLATLLARWTGDRAAGFAGGVSAGVLATVWRNATETEVYAAALLLAAAALWAADRAGRTESRRPLLLAAYLLALAVPLHPFALVAAPAVILLAALPPTMRPRPAALLHLGGGVALAMALGTARPLLAAGGALLLAGGVALDARAGIPRRGLGTAFAMLALVALAASALAVLRVRAGFDPALNQGNPGSWATAVDAVARRQYAVAGPWPRQAPLWLQLGNVLEWADWQVALGLAPGVSPAWTRTPITIIWALLAVAGARAHRRADRRSWLALLALLVAGSVGVVLQLNLKAGPSFGWGILPDTAAREARERDYFFVLAFWAWGAWAALGAVTLSRRRLGGRAWPGVAVALLPIALNWRAADRRGGPHPQLARDAALAVLTSAPARSVVLTAGDNDTYPVWYLQQVERVRRDVIVIPVSLLPAGWYRAELARRWALGEGGAWMGSAAALRALARDAERQGRPVSTTLGVAARERAMLGRRWS